MQQPAFELLRPGSDGDPPDLPGLDLEERIGAGELFDVYRARHSADGSPVVVKLARAPGSAARQLLRHEAEILELCRHSAVVRLVRLIDTEDSCALVTALEAGESLAQRLTADAETWDEDRLRRLLSELLDPLAAIHERGVVHGDLKPGNIVVRPDGSPVLVDFGSAHRPAAMAQGRETSRLTPGYAAPERYLTEGREGAWSDLYSLAAIAYRVLTGQVPQEAVRRLERDGLVPLVDRSPAGFSRGFLAALDAALALDSAARPQTAEAWRELLLSEPRYARPDVAEDPNYPPTIEVRRRPQTTAVDPGRVQALPDETAAPGKSRRGAGLAIGGLLLAVAAAAYPAWEGYKRYLKSEWTVSADGSGDSRTIAGALAQARGGAVIEIRPGVYRESVIMDQTAILRGIPDADGTLPVIEPVDGACLRIAAAGGRVSRLHFRGAGNVADSATAVQAPACLQVGASGFRIEESRFEGLPVPALLVEAGATGTIVDSVLTGTEGAGLVVRQGAAPDVVGNVIERSGQAGILIEDGAGGRYENNSILAGNGAGIEVRDGGDPVIIGNRIEANREAGLYVYRGGRGTYRDNRIADNGYSGVIVASGAAPRFDDNEIAGNGQHGVLLLDSGSGILSGNSIVDNDGHGIAHGMSARVDLEDNRLVGNREPQLQRGAIEQRQDTR